MISDLNEVTDSGQYSCQAKQLQQSQSPASDLVAVGHLQLSIKGELGANVSRNECKIDQPADEGIGQRTLINKPQ